MLDNMKIGKRIMTFSVLSLFFVSFGIGLISYMLSSNALQKNIEYTLISLSQQGARLVNQDLMKFKIILEGVANRNVIRSMDWEGKQAPALKDEIERTEFIGMGIADLSGNTRYPDGSTADLSDRSYFKEALLGKTVVSDVIISKVTNSAVMVVATPIKDESGKIAAILIGRLPGETLTAVTDSLKYGEKGYSYILAGNGNVIAHNNRDLVTGQENFIEKGKTDKKFEALAEINKKMIAGETGFGGYSYLGEYRYMGYTPIPGTNWSLSPSDHIKTMFSVRSLL
jgi:methyl-accepting chemotaxis protein